LKKLKIAILGTRGIPNQYGGFEQFAEYLSVRLVKKGHDVTVYNPHFHRHQKDTFQGVKIIKKWSPEAFIGAAANFLYDYLCLRDALKKNYDVILECGYNPAALFYYICPIEKSVIITNMDGMEWKRNKWNTITKKMIRFFEKCGVKKSHYLVADNPAIAEYFLQTYGRESEMIPYAAKIFSNPDVKVLSEYNITEKSYYLLIARLEPENNVEMILDGYIKSKSDYPFLVIGKLNTKHAQYLVKRYRKYKNLRFLGGIYDIIKINNLRFYSLAYFHGHSVGGTNPSLLEAMACGCFIMAHDNAFNKYVLGENAKYFNSDQAVRRHIDEQLTDKTYGKKYAANNAREIEKRYNWEVITEQYERLLIRSIE